MPTRLASTALLFALFTALPAAADDAGTLYFEGQIVESGCTVQAMPNELAGANALPINAETSLQIAEHNDACVNHTQAFTTQYLPLNASATERDNRVITLTYN